MFVAKITIRGKAIDAAADRRKNLLTTKSLYYYGVLRGHLRGIL